MPNKKLPELLSPAGSFEAFQAAVDGGADAIYMGGASFNARINAPNLSLSEQAEAIRLAHMYGIKVYQTVNTMMFDRELSELLREAERAAENGIDAFIVSDIGAATLLHERLPEIALHASTQMSIHNADGARLLSKLGFTRVVPAREMSARDIAALVRDGTLEVEIFVHGALCVSHSGQCLFSSLVGTRSGNRGLCAQPCRLPYSCGDGGAKNGYPLSLKDLSLAKHIREITDSGVASLKIEGRMKSPEYVRGVTAIWRRLLDSEEDASDEDMRELAAFFSRGGFTDGYYKNAIGRGMLGVRSDEEKQTARELDRFTKIERKIPVDMSVELTEGAPSRLTVTGKKSSVTVTGDVVRQAINAPLDCDSVKRCMSKLGDTSFCLNGIDISLGDGVMMPISRINALRRDGISELERALLGTRELRFVNITPKAPTGAPKKRNVGRFRLPSQVTAKVRGFFDIILLPLEQYAETDCAADGFVMPPVMFDSERDYIAGLLKKASLKCPRYAVISNFGQISVVTDILPKVKLIADLRFNIANDASIAFFERLGFDSMVTSAELSLPQIRDLGGARATVVYGRITLMTLEKCVIKELYGKRSCEICSVSKAKMRDRRGFVFPILRELPHRNLVLNSLPTCMSDKQRELEAAMVTDRHFLFTVESSDEVDRVIENFKSGRASDVPVRRI